MLSRYFENNTEEERIAIFQEYFDRDLESFFSSTIACCDECYDEFQRCWPGTVSHDIELQRGCRTIADFLQNSRIQDNFYPEEIECFSKSLECPNCGAVLDGEFWVYEHPFDVPREFSVSLDEIANLASHTPFLLLTHEFALEVFNVIVALGRETLPRPIHGNLYRARKAEGLPSPVLCDFSAPPAHVVEEGRYNHAGHPMVYLAESQSTAFAEIALSGSRFHVAEMSFRVPLRILDLKPCQEARTRAEMTVQCLARSSLCAAPREGAGWARREYVFTRFVADCARHAGFDGISFGSTKDISGANLVLLNAPADFASVASLVAIRTMP